MNFMRQRNLLKQITDYVSSGKVSEPLKSPDFDFLSKRPSFISKHCVGNGKYREFFIKVDVDCIL